MSHYDVYENFLVEYDKMSDPNTYPSLTKEEACIMLNKAYLALIAQKLTGNNPRSIQFESDNKAIEDIRPLLKTTTLDRLTNDSIYPSNAILYTVTSVDDFLYYIQSQIKLDYSVVEGEDTIMSGSGKVDVNLVTHQTAQKYMYTLHNKPWIESPVCYIEGDYIIVLIDERHSVDEESKLYLTYIKKPTSFTVDTVDDNSGVDIELSDTTTQELINLAIIMSAETVESPRTTSKLNLRPLES